MKKRSQIPQQYKWNVENLYKNEKIWKKDYQYLKDNVENILQFKGKLNSVEVLNDFFSFTETYERTLEKVYTYSHLRHDEDTSNSVSKAHYQEAQNLFYRYSELAAFVSPELLALSQETIDVLLNSKNLELYRHHLEQIFRSKPHILSQSEETLLSLSQRALSTGSASFSALNNADLKFGIVLHKKKKFPLTHASYQNYLSNPDRELRRKTFIQYHREFKGHENTIASLLSGQVRASTFNARARKFESALHQALYPKNIDAAVYHSLIEAVHKGIKSLHRYYKIKKKALKLKEFHLYDQYVPIVPKFNKKYSYDTAKKLVIESVAPLGEEYQNLLSKGLESGWVDVYENENKRNGAYSSGCYDSMPYILMNYNDELNAVFTLAHEAGHSMHSLLSRRHQPYIYSDYSIFVAEVASTFNEEMLYDYLLERSSSQQEELYLLDSQINAIKGTLFRQVMFAEFELMIHQLDEADKPITHDLLNVEYKKLNRFYFGNHVVIDDEIEIEWTRISHFYYNYYVYQYATGISAAIALHQMVKNGTEKERDLYLQFLKSGNSKYPLEVLKDAGVDMTTTEPVIKAIKKFEVLLSKMEKLL